MVPHMCKSPRNHPKPWFLGGCFIGGRENHNDVPHGSSEKCASSFLGDSSSWPRAAWHPFFGGGTINWRTSGGSFPKVGDINLQQRSSSPSKVVTWMDWRKVKLTRSTIVFTSKLLEVPLPQTIARIESGHSNHDDNL